MLNGEIRRGDIYYIMRFDTYGCEQQTGRPAVVVSNDANNKYSQTISVVYLTTKDKKDMATHVPIKSSRQESTALCEQVTTVDRDRFGDYMATCSDEEMDQVDKAVTIALALGRAKDQVPTDEMISSMVPIELSKPFITQLEPMVSKEEYTVAVSERDVYKNLYEKLLERVLK